MSIEIIKFWGKSCGNCKTQETILNAVLAERPDVKLVKHDVADAPELVEEYGVSTLPTMLIMKDGEMVEKLVGLKPKGVVLKCLS